RGRLDSETGIFSLGRRRVPCRQGCRTLGESEKGVCSLRLGSPKARIVTTDALNLQNGLFRISGDKTNNKTDEKAGRTRLSRDDAPAASTGGLLSLRCRYSRVRHECSIASSCWNASARPLFGRTATC